MPLAYRGYATAITISATYTTTPPTISFYSAMDHFHGPASTDRKLHYSVTNTRDTRSFATRRVQVKQKQSNGRFHAYMELLADFHVKDPSTLAYSKSPSFI